MSYVLMSAITSSYDPCLHAACALGSYLSLGMIIGPWKIKYGISKMYDSVVTIVSWVIAGIKKPFLVSNKLNVGISECWRNCVRPSLRYSPVCNDVACDLNNFNKTSLQNVDETAYTV